MKKLFLMLVILTLTACGSPSRNPCPEPERKGLYEMRDHYACLERELGKLSSR